MSKTLTAALLTALTLTGLMAITSDVSAEPPISIVGRVVRLAARFLLGYATTGGTTGTVMAAGLEA